MIKPFEHTHLDRFRDIIAGRLGLDLDEGKRDLVSGVLQRRLEARGGLGPAAYLDLLSSSQQSEEMRLRASNKELEAFVYSVSHDLRAPLRALDGFSDALISQYHDLLDDKGKHYLHRIQEGSLRMGQLIDDLLNLSRITRRDINLQRVDLSALAADIAAELRAEHPQHQVECVIAPDLAAVGDPHLLRIALQNLLANAWKFSGKCQSAHIEFGAKEQDGERVYSVRDNGVGFDMAYAGKLFAPFQRLHGAQEFPGTGIGLATAQRIVIRHGGRIWGEGAEGKGATFYFTLAKAL
jgi:light-regulated signal transduction histidine kinase (bacteriophytochrome)